MEEQRLKIHRAQQKGRDFVHQRKIEIDVNDRAVSGNDQTALSFTPTSIDSLSVFITITITKQGHRLFSMSLF